MKANKATATVASIVKAIDDRQVEKYGAVLALAIHDLVRAEGAIDTVNATLTEAKKAKLPWGDARSKAKGLVHVIRAEFESKGWPKGQGLDNWIATLAWCYKEGVRVQVKKLEQQKAPERIQLDLLTGEVKSAPTATVEEVPNKTRAKKEKSEKTAAHWLIKAKTESGYIPIMGHFAALIRIMTDEQRKGFDVKAVERLMNEALVKSKLAKMDGNEVKAI